MFSYTPFLFYLVKIITEKKKKTTSFRPSALSAFKLIIWEKVTVATWGKSQMLSVLFYKQGKSFKQGDTAHTWQ